MKDKEKQIEEMAKDLKEIETDVGHILLNETFSYVKEHKKYNPKKDFSNAHTKTFEELTAEEMFKKGYRKLPENASFILGSRGSGKTATQEYIRLSIQNVVKDILSMFDDRNYITENDLKNAIAKRYKVKL